MNGDFYALKNWRNVLAELPSDSYDVFHLYDYHEAFAEIENAKSEAFIYKDNETIILLPYLRRLLDVRLCNRINSNGLSDITGVYGYAGIVGKNFSHDHISRFMNYFDEYCKSQKIVSSFLRLHPLLIKSQLNSLLNTRKVNEVVIVPLSKDLDAIKNGFREGVIKSLKKASKLGYQVKKFNEIPIDIFFSIYAETLQRNNATNFFCLSKDFLSKINNIPKIHSTYVAYLDEQPVSTELVLHSHKNWHSFLGGTLTNHLKSGVNTLLKYEIILDAAKAGANSFILGGGIRPGDGIHKYKESFAKGQNQDFNAQCNVHLNSVYSDLINDFEIRSLNFNYDSNLFQRYNLLSDCP